MEDAKEVKHILVRYLSVVALLLLGDVLYAIVKPMTFYASYAIASLIYPTSLISQDVFLVSDQALEFVPACAALAAYLLLFILILVTRGINLRLGVKLAALGALVIFVANILRIELLIAVLVEYGNNLFETLHLLVWKVLSTVFVTGVWIYFVLKYKIRGVPVYSDVMLLARIKKNQRRSRCTGDVKR